MADKEQMRKTALNDSEAYNQKRRFGLFSQPVSTAIGDNGPYRGKVFKKDESGKPVTQQRGIYTKPTRSGQLKKSYFSDINSLAASHVPDEFIDPDRKLLQIENQRFAKGYSKEQPFKSSSNNQQLHKPSYEYKEQNNPELNPKRNRQQDGKVRCQPPNFTANLQSTVIHRHFKQRKYMQDPYERQFQQESLKRKKDRSMEKPERFKLNSCPKGLFGKNMDIFGTDVEFAQKKQRDPKFNIYSHENKWKSNNPNKSGLNGCFQPFPQYKEDPIREATRKPPAEKKESFRRMSVALSKPSPSIAYTARNLGVMNKTIGCFSNR